MNLFKAMAGTLIIFDMPRVPNKLETYIYNYNDIIIGVLDQLRGGYFPQLVAVLFDIHCRLRTLA